VLDGSPKEPAYPYNPYAGDPGHTEGWVTFNTPWNISLAYLAAERTSIAVYDETFSYEIKSVKPGMNIGIELTAPLNFGWGNNKEAEVVIYLNEGRHSKMLEKACHSSGRFRGIFTVPGGSNSYFIKAAYGHGWHEAAKELPFQ
jgi:hypothetical protein